MTGKAKRFLRAKASIMPATVQIGKAGLEEAVIESARKAIEANELIKVKVLTNCSEDKEKVLVRLAHELQGELIQIIGRNGVIYKARPEPIIILP